MTIQPLVRCPIAALVNGACTGCRYCEALWEALENESGPEVEPRG